MLIALAIVTGFVLLVWSADLFVKGAAAIAKNLGVSAGLVGRPIVSVGTSSPAILVSISAALAGAGQLAIGNAIGSNIANIALVLGVTVCFCSIKVEHTYLKLEIPILLSITTLVALLIVDRQLSTMDSGIMIITLLITLSLIVRSRFISFSEDSINDNVTSKEVTLSVLEALGAILVTFALNL